MGVEGEAQRRGVGLDLYLGWYVIGGVVAVTEPRIQDRPPVYVRIAVVRADVDRDIDLLRRHVVAEHVATVVGEPESLGIGMPGHADGIAHPVGVHGGLARGRVHAQDAGKARVVGLAHVARRADRHIEEPVRADRQVLPAVVSPIRQFVGNDLGPRPVTVGRLDVGVAQDAVERRDVEIPAEQGNAARHGQARGEGDDLGIRICIVGRNNGVHLPGAARADEQEAGVGEGHLPRIGNVVGEYG